MVLELLSYWKKWPPVHVLVKKGFFQEEEQPRTITDPDQLASLIKDF